MPTCVLIYDEEMPLLRSDGAPVRRRPLAGGVAAADRHLAMDDEQHMDNAFFEQLRVDCEQCAGADGRPAFAIPLDLSSQDSALLALDHHHDGGLDDA